MYSTVVFVFQLCHKRVMYVLMKCVRIKEMESIDPFRERGDAG